MPHKPSKTRPANIQSQERRLEALKLRALRMSYTDIGLRMGISRQRACQLVQEELEAISNECRETAERVRNLESISLDNMQMALARQVNAGDTTAIDKTLKIMERRARLLGLDAPTKVAPTTPDGENPYEAMSREELREIAARIVNGNTSTD